MKIEKQSFVDLAADALRLAILKGEIAPGARLRETALAERMEVGRATVRAALSLLDAEELIVRQPYAAWRVSEITETAIWEIYTLRGALEGLAAGLCAKALNDTIRQTLGAAYTHLEIAEADSEGRDRVDADLNFHRLIVRSCNHGSLLRQYSALSNKVERLYRWSEQNWPRRISLTDWHKPILDSIFSGSPERAEKEIRLHIENSLADDLRDFAEHQKRRA